MNKYIKIVAIIISIGIIAVLYLLFFIKSSNQKTVTLKIKREIKRNEFDALIKQTLELPFSISGIAKLAGYNFNPCKIDVPPKTNVINLITLLRKNRNQSVNLVITAGGYKNQIIEKVIKSTAIEKQELLQFFDDSMTMKRFNIDQYTWPMIFIPNTYNVLYKIDVEGLFSRMKIEQDKFWLTNNRLTLCKKQGFTPIQALILASIVEKESSKVSEYGKIAAVYINRLRSGMKLQADPTIVFIKGVAERVKGDEDLKKKSPYNTYINKGLPPGPICIPSVNAIDSVLNYAFYDYLFFCAKSDFSGYHLFEKSYPKHQVNARKFHIALNEQEKIRAKKRGINPPSNK